MRSWVGSRTGNYSHSIFFALVAGCLLLAPSTAVLGQALPKRPSKPKQHTQTKTTPQLDLTQPPVIPGMPFVHIVPYGTPRKMLPSPLSSAGGRFPYWGGPVISNIHVVEVLWGSFVDVASTSGLSLFLADITNSNYFDLLSEYGTVGVTGAGGAPGSDQLIGRGFFDGKVTITPSICPGGANNPSCTISNSQIQAELLRQLVHLPAPVKDAHNNYNTIYLLYFPPGVHITIGTTGSCQTGGFCAYHASLNGGLPSEIPYGVFPDFGPNSACRPSNGCGNNTSANNLTSATSHEIGEAVTDANIGNATQLGPPLAWFSNTDDEIGDICNQDQQQITAGGHTYTAQALFSNMQNACVIAPAQLILSAPGAGAIPGKSFNLTVTASSPAVGTLTLYSNTIHFTSSDAQAVLPADYTFVPNTDGGIHTFSVTLNSLNSQTIAATDTLAAPITGSATVNVSHNPDLTITKTHTGNFSQGQTGAHYTLTVSNVGDISSTATVTVTDSLPSDLTATAMAGTGWACTLATLTCTRADALAANASYPAVTLMVNFSDTAPASIVNIATVSGGGEANLLNDQASDPTTVIQFPDPTPFLTDSANFSQGATGVQYTVIVQNIGNAPTVGSVALTVALGTGVTATAISGQNWNCVLATLRCSRSDSVPGLTYYDPIQITVNVALNAPISVTSTAVVSGGGEINTSNDTSIDGTGVSGPVPDFIIASSHIGNFRQGQAGAIFDLTVKNIGPVPSINPVMVVELPEFGFTLTGLAGTGWTCPPSQSICTRGDALAPAASYPPITVTVDVASGAAPSLNNIAQVSGVDEINTMNDAAIDNVTILGVPDLTSLSSHQGSFGQGETGAVYTLTAINNGGATSSGVITLTDTLPAGLTATAMSGTGWTCTLTTLTCTSTAPVFSASQQITLTVNVALNAPSSVANMVTVSGGGETNITNNTWSDVTQIAPPVLLTAFNGGNQVTAGQPAVFGIAVASFAPNPVVLSCTGLPAGAACSFSPPSVTGQISDALTITTMAPTRSAKLRMRNTAVPFYAILLPLLGLFVMRQSKGKAKLTGSAALLTLVLLVACGGGGSSTPPPPLTLHGGTPAGNYTITVTATDTAASLQGSTTVTLSVNWNGL